MLLGLASLPFGNNRVNLAGILSESYGKSAFGREQMVMRVFNLESTSNMTGNFFESTHAASGCSAQEGVAYTVYGLLGEGPGGVSKQNLRV